MRPYILAETNLKDLKDRTYSLAVLPWGATEAHNYHLPFGTDNFETEALAAEGAKLAWESGTSCLVLPCISYGVNTGQHDIPGTMNIYPSTQAMILHDLIESLYNFGIRKLVILNGHGGNDFKQILRETGRDFPELFLATANWYQSVDKTKYFEHDGDHADEMESSLMLYIKPELVLPLEEAGNGDHRNFTPAALREKWAWSERKWSKVTRDTGIGNPKKANKAKGEGYFQAVSNKLAELFKEIAELDPEDPYE